MQTPPVNFRYRGLRESRKFVVQLGASVSDLTKLVRSTAGLENSYETQIPSNSTTLDTTYQAALQKAKLLVGFARRIIY